MASSRHRASNPRITSVQDSSRQLWSPTTVQRGLVGLMTICHQPCHHSDRNVAGTAMARMRNLQQLLALVKHRFQQCATAQYYFLVQQEQTVGYVPLQVSHEP